MTGEGQLRDWLDGLAAYGGAVSAAEAIVADDRRILLRHASGYRVAGELLVAGQGARFDAASLTKPWMATLALVLDGRGDLPLSAQVAELAPEAAPELAGRTLEDLLRHRSGLAAWAPLAVKLRKRLGDRAAVRRFLAQATPEALGVRGRDLRPRAAGTVPSAGPALVPGGSHAQPRPSPLYSDLGYLLWGLLVEQALGSSLGDLLDRLVCSPLGLDPVGRRSLERTNAVECHFDNGKEVELAAEQGLDLIRVRAFLYGTPQDGNARALRAAGVPTAHAGLFLCADEVLSLAREWMRPGRLLSDELERRALADGGPFALGWWRRSDTGAAGSALSQRAFGHTGFTGGSVWIDPERKRIYVLMAHRLRSEFDFNPFRREFHRLAAALED